MRRMFGGLLPVLLICAAAPAIALGGQPITIEHDNGARVKPAVRRKQRKALASAPTRWRRSRGGQAKPKKRPNRMHISKRVRRKHRRAA